MLQIKNLHWWVGKVDILKGIDFHVKKSEAIGIVWPNGCGKTSFINCINGFNKLTKGRVSFQGEDITKRTIEYRARLWIGRVFQSFGIFKNLTLFENLSLAYITSLPFYYKLLPLSYLPKQVKKEISEVLKELDLYKKRDTMASELSWGQMRLLEIARLYLQDTQIYLLDEPTAWVSPKLKKSVVKIIKKILAKWKIVIIVEHDFSWLWEFVQRLVVMDDGKIVLDGEYKKIKNSNKLKEIYFWL